MNRLDFQAIAYQRLHEAEHLLVGRYFSGAYYLAGYAVECALKACVAKQTQLHDFPPDLSTVREIYTHSLVKLLRIAGLEQSLTRHESSGLRRKWATVQEWNENSRYQIVSQEDTTSMLDAVGNRDEGVLLWLTQHW